MAIDFYETDETADWLITLQKQRKAQDPSYLTDLEIIELAAKRRKDDKQSDDATS